LHRDPSASPSGSDASDEFEKSGSRLLVSESKQ